MIVRREDPGRGSEPLTCEEKMVLRSWCSVVVRMVAFLRTPEGAQAIDTIKLPADEVHRRASEHEKTRCTTLRTSVNVIGYHMISYRYMRWLMLRCIYYMSRVLSSHFGRFA